MVKYFRYLLVFFFIPKGLFCQLITNPAPPISLVQNILLGPGVTVSNITFNGSPSAIGSFSATGTNLGIDQGIVMTTGTILNTGSGPQGPNNQANAGVDNNLGGSVLLSNLINGTQTYNAAILEFDFVPYSDTVKFKYVFGSDEYPEFAPPNNNGFNDVFGFFISGPGITGFQNIAKLPNNGGIVSINNVNAITNSSFYNFNGDGNSAPYNSNTSYIQYDGFTDVLEAVSQVQCGETYHLVLAVADVGDGQWDSGIFLEANSLTSQTPITINYSISDTLFASPSILAEGCVSGTVTLTREDNLNTTITIPIIVSGTATNNLDYSGVPASVTFSPGETEISFDISTIYDAQNESQENIILSFLMTDPCGNITPFEVNLFIQDVQPMSVSINNPTILCPGDNVLLTATVTGGLTPYSYNWSNGQNTNSISISPQLSSVYSVVVTGQCTNSSVSDTVFVSVPVFQPLVVQLGADIIEICPFLEDTLFANITGGVGNYVIQWNQNNSIISGENTNDLTINPGSSTLYTIVVTDDCDLSGSDSLQYTITSPPLFVSTSVNPEICPGDSIYISAQASGGYGSYSYYWTDLGIYAQGVWVAPEISQSYIVEVSDECQTFTTPAVADVIVSQPIADFTVLTEEPMLNLLTSFQNTSSNATSFTWYFGDGFSSNEMNPTHTYTNTGQYNVTLIITNATGCIDSITKPIKIVGEFYFYIPNSFSPNEDNLNAVFSGEFIGLNSLQISIFNRWGEEVYSSKEIDFAWDGTFDGVMVPNDTYSWVITYKRKGARNNQISGHVNVIR